MLKFKRPQKPGDFDTKSKTQLDKIKAQINANKKPEFNDGFWGNYKHLFMEAQSRRCGYCEVIITTDYGDMEHYRPKSVVNQLSQAGAEVDNLNTTKGRVFGKLCDRGYWWLAYDWDNYLLSCKICNQRWKEALFPIKEERAKNPANSEYPCVSPKDSDQETPLLMNPYDSNLNPVDHFEISKVGLIKPKGNSELGRATINTCGLDREGLNIARNTSATLIYMLFKNFTDADDGSEQEKNSIDLILTLGSETSSTHPGVCRIIFEQLTDGDFTWSDLENWDAD